MVINFVLLIGFLFLIKKYEKPFIPAILYAVSKALLGTLLYFVITSSSDQYPITHMLIATLVSFLITFGIAYLIAWLLLKHEGKAWVYVVATVLVIPTFLV